MFLAVIDWVLPIVLGLLIGILLVHSEKARFHASPCDEGRRVRARNAQGPTHRYPFRRERTKHVRINGSRHFAKRSVLANLPKLRRDQPVYLCTMQTLSPQLKNIAKAMIRKGFKPIYLLEGGLEKWPYSVKENE
ncbi:MAG: rhodanese-like domain-containing protein [Bacillus subtilis]|nr:rhodanese-like domain-containing protein [Bacillus subtilis]